MKRIVIALVLALFLFAGLSGCTAERKSQLEGTWELVDAKHTPDPAFKLAEWRQTKVITRTHWVFLAQKKDRQMFSGAGTDAEWLNAARSFEAGGGTYTLAGDTYTEHIQYFSLPNFVNVSIPYKIKCEGDQLIQMGTIPLKSLGLADGDMELYEVYQRVK
jgi:hypothetical protein